MNGGPEGSGAPGGAVGGGRWSRFDPLRGIANRGEVVAWGMYDLANQSFTLLINTLLFPVFFREIVVGSGRSATGDRLWSAMVSGSLLVVVVVSPVVGAMADARGWRKRMLIGTGVVCASATIGLGLVGAGSVWVAVAVYAMANIAFQLGENFLASYLPSVATGRTIGRVSAIGWAMGYAGALGLLAISLAAMGLFGWEETAAWRPLIVFAGVWFLLGIVPPMVVLKEPAADAGGAGVGAMRLAAMRVRETWTHAGRHSQLMRFLAAFFIYAMGVQAVIFFSGVVAKEVVFAGDPRANIKLVLFIAQLTVTAGIAAVVAGKVQDRIGARVMALVFLGVWLVSVLGFAAFSAAPGAPEWAFWLLGNGIGFGLGGIGTASRSLVGRFTPGHRAAEFFGLWGMVYKGAGVVGVFVFGQTRAAAGDAAALVVLAGFFAAGFAGTAMVRETRGVRAARRAERDRTRALERAAEAQYGARAGL